MSPRPWIFTVSIAAALWCLAALVPRTPAVTTEPAAKFESGLTITFDAATGDAKEPADARTARLAALYVPAGTPPSISLPAGPFTATFGGAISSRIKDAKVFSAEGHGDLHMTLNDTVVLDLHGEFAGKPSDPVKLKKGKNLLSIRYTSPPTDDASFRLLWADPGRLFDPVPPTVLSHDPTDGNLIRHSKRRAGRELVATMRCLDCHMSQAAEMGAMPEMKQDTPNLADLGSRLNPEWIAYWITNPRALRPAATMPRIFHDTPATDAPQAGPRAFDIAAYLVTTSPHEPSAKIQSDIATVSAGARLFTGLGCVACHVAPGIEDSDPTLNRVGLAFVKAKFTPDGLKAFLLKPEAHYAWIRMPNFHLSDEEATALTSFLLTRAKNDVLQPGKELPDPIKGKALFESVGCTSCHAVDSTNTLKPAGAIELSKANWNKGCAADSTADIGKGVEFSFTPEQRESLRAFASSDWTCLQRDPANEFIARSRVTMRCNACHNIDDRDNIWSNLDQEIGQIEQDLPPPEDQPALASDQSRPPLTWAGEKLRPQWTASFIAGQVPYKPRSWLSSRMPAFASRAAALARGMAIEHGVSPQETPSPPPDGSQADIGKPLTSRTGFSCIQCHAVADQPPLAPFEAPAPNFAYVTSRLRHDYYTRWMRHPGYYLPGTKMPQFSDAAEKTAYKNILDGDASKQYEAIWNYLLAGDKITPAQ